MTTLDEIQARADAATDGPWEVTAFDSGHSRFEMSASICTSDTGDSICDMDGLSRSYNEKWATDDGYLDAQFIAHARGDVPRLVAALRAVEAVHVKGTGHNPDCHCGIEPDAGARCKGCRRDWPCPTITAIREGLGE